MRNERETSVRGEVLEHARALARRGEDEAAKQAYIDILRADPTHFYALNELAALAWAGGFRTAARTAYMQAIAHHPDDVVARVNLANLLREEQDVAGARAQFEAALARDPALPEAHQGMAWVLGELGLDGVEEHRRRGFAGRSLVTQPHRGTGGGVPLILLVSARGGNIPTRLWINDRHFTVHAIYADYYEPDRPLPAHALVMNAIGDADLCQVALDRAGALTAGSIAPVINRPAQVRMTGRAQNAQRLGAIPDVIAPRMDTRTRSSLESAADVKFPLLLRSLGFHTGRHFVEVSDRDALAGALVELKGEELLAIQYLDARGADGFARKYRVVFIDGVLYPCIWQSRGTGRCTTSRPTWRAMPAFARRNGASSTICRACWGLARCARSSTSARRSGSSMPGSILRSRPRDGCSCSRPTRPWRWCRPGPRRCGITGAHPSRPPCRRPGACSRPGRARQPTRCEARSVVFAILHASRV